MTIKCPKCKAENSDTKSFCGDCGTHLPASEGTSPLLTNTLQTPQKNLIKGSTFAGRYKIIAELGIGGMGVAYKAEDTKLKRTVALKLLPPELTHIPEVKERFMIEDQAAALWAIELDENSAATHEALDLVRMLTRGSLRWRMRERGLLG